MSTHDDASPNDPQAQNDGVFALLSDADRHRIWERLARTAKQKPAVEPKPLTDFDRTFQQIVPAKLEPAIRLGAYMVRLELEDFSCAYRRVMRIAQKYGASHLSTEAFLALGSWIDQQLLACVDEPPPKGVVTPEQLARIMREVP